MNFLYSRILLKLSGESLAGDKHFGFDDNVILNFVEEISELCNKGIQVGLVVGGGNIFRGNKANMWLNRIDADYMGMLGTVINGLALKSAFGYYNVKANVFTAIEMLPIGERYVREKVLECLNKNQVAIFTFGTSNPFFTTDTTAVLRAAEINADVILKATRVDGVYDKDPEKFADAKKYDQLTFKEALEKGLKIMDLTAYSLCKENNIPVIVFNIHEKGNLLKIVQGQKVGTLITP